MSDYLPSDYVSYDKETGRFSWLKSRKGVRASVGNINSNGYLSVCIKGKRYLGHRLAWYLSYGEWPPDTVDHIDGDRSNNRLVNLRLATRSQNQSNRRAKGYSYHKRSRLYQARICVGGKETYLGWFKTPQEARKAYEDALPVYHKEFANFNTEDDNNE
jgi:hypothetical protein